MTADWQRAIRERMEQQDISAADLAYYLSMSRERVRQLLQHDFTDEAAANEQRKRLEEALGWCIEHAPQNRIAQGQEVNGCIVLRRQPKGLWLMRCETCLKEFLAVSRLILQGKAHCTNCTRYVAEDFRERVFNKWTVLGYAGRKPATHWWCQCSCGSIRSVSEYNLRDGASKGCSKCCQRHSARPQRVLVPVYHPEDEEEGGDPNAR